MNRAIPTRCFAAALVLVLLLAPAACASDHADPIFESRLEAGITDLFAFPTKDGLPTDKGGDRLVLVLCTRRSLAKAPPYPGLNELHFQIFMDLNSQVTFTDKADRDRYGGTVVRPEGIKEGVTISIRLDDNAQLKGGKGEVSGLEKAGRIRWWSGLRDDPFIFPQFFGTNVIAVVIGIPFDCFPKGQQTFLLWATSSRHGAQIDHVGRSQRTQLPRFDFLNTLHPKDHVAAIRERRDNPGVLADLARRYIQPEFAIRTYDLHPDVMVYNRQEAVKFPNGRQLEDDVAKLTCEQGDCQLFELSFAHPRSREQGGGRPAKNDRPFSKEWPYLGEPQPNPTPPTPPALTTRTHIILVSLGVVVLAVFLLPWVLYFRALRNLRVALRRSGAPGGKP